ncbi:phage major capsid protein [Lactobacillus sp. ESL0791]|uniref:phage major capsid protein n=1 Tax=Lactobacillus sp. ESL0791 TaxID=2983234 RepID=UPI0023F65F6F|nr:phage major capsid protein [Lactobacillus sp. ESL0791]MDF7639957.1 phage major capsid protein [Lactobacillus sp. ESL0791]
MYLLTMSLTDKDKENNLNTRSRPIDFKTRDLANGNHEISGYAIVFNQPSEDMGFTEYISPSALNGVDFSNLMLLYGHDFNQILARTDSKTLSVKIDDKGLFFVAELPNTTLGNDTFTDIQNGNIKGASFRFDIADDGDSWQEDENGTLIHTVTKISDVPEISLTPLPAYQETSVQIQRSLTKYKKEEINLSKEKTRDTSTATNDEKDVATNTDIPDKSDDTNTTVPDFSSLVQVVNQLEKAVEALGQSNTEETASAEDNKIEDTDDSDSDDTTDDADTDDEDEKIDETRSLTKKEEQPRVKIKSTNINNNQDAQLRGFADYVKSHGATRDNITTGVEGQVLVPKQVLDAYHQPEDKNSLTSLVNRVAVTSPSGSLPIIKKGTARFTTKAELAQNPELAKMGIGEVAYNLQTYAGSLPISNEMLSDYSQINSLVAQYLTDMRGLTEQDKIGAILTQATAVTANDADGLKDAVNIGLANYDKQFIMTESAYNFIDKLKDGNGRYLFEDSISSASGKTLLGLSVTVVPDAVLGGSAKAFIGDPKAFVLEAYKDESSIKWMDNDLYSQKLAAYIRADFKVADADAGKLITLTAGAPKSGK